MKVLILLALTEIKLEIGDCLLRSLCDTYNTLDHAIVEKALIHRLVDKLMAILKNALCVQALTLGVLHPLGVVHKLLGVSKNVAVCP